LPGENRAFMYDIIGDVHGEADKLKLLLDKIGYEKKNGVYSHPERKAVFVGDFINRGPKVKETIQIIRAMVENGKAFAILGNHELNAIFYYLKDEEGKYYARRKKYRLSLDQTLKDFADNISEFKEHLKWMRTLPLFLDFGDIRVVHACWKDENIALIKEHFSEGKIKKEKLREIFENNVVVAKSIWETCKGIDFKLPKDLLVFDSSGRPHRTFRMKWWMNPQGHTFKKISMESRFKLPKYTVPKEIVKPIEPYPEDAPIVFFGHYCLNNKSGILADNLCCVDSCVSRNRKLMVYRWSGEKKLDAENIYKV